MEYPIDFTASNGVRITEEPTEGAGRRLRISRFRSIVITDYEVDAMREMFVALTRAEVDAKLLEDESWRDEECIRVSGEMECPECKRPWWRHRSVSKEAPTLIRACDGRLLKI